MAESAPYLVTITVAAIAWAFTHTVDRLTDTPFLKYTIEEVRSGDKYSTYIVISNITRNKTFKKINLLATTSIKDVVTGGSIIPRSPAFEGDNPPTIAERTFAFTFPQIEPGWQFEVSIIHNTSDPATLRLSTDGDQTFLATTRTMETFLLEYEIPILMIFIVLAAAALGLSLRSRRPDQSPAPEAREGASAHTRDGKQMEKQPFIPLICLVSVFLSSAALAQTAAPEVAPPDLQITVIDDNNTGVRSKVLIYKSPSTTPDNQILLGETDDKGAYSDKYKCDRSHVIVAHPLNIGAYFRSSPMPCRQKVSIPVLRRFAFDGKALSGTTTAVILPDGSPGLVATWAYVETNAIETQAGGGGGSGTVCDVNVRPTFNSKIFQLDGDKLKVVGTGDSTSAITAISGLAKTHSAIFPSNCTEAKGRIINLENAAATAGATFSEKAFGPETRAVFEALMPK